MTHILAIYLTDLKLTYNDVVDGIGAADTPVANDTQLSFDDNLSDQLKCDTKLKGNSRRKVPPSTMDRLVWKENRTALATMIGYLVDQNAGVALIDVTDACFARVGKEKSYTVALADKTFVDLFRQWLVAGEELVAFAGVTKYQD